MSIEPTTVAMHDDLALLRVDVKTSSYPDYYIYQAIDDASSGNKPSLTLLPPTPYKHFHITGIGLLRRPGNNKEFIAAGFSFLHEDFPGG